jgi:hypothetical protein
MGHDARGHDDLFMNPPTWLVHHHPAEWLPDLGFPTVALSPRAMPEQNADTAGICDTLLMSANRTLHDIDPSLRYLRHGKALTVIVVYRSFSRQHGVTAGSALQR